MRVKVIFGGCSTGDRSMSGTLTDELAKFRGHVVLIRLGIHGMEPVAAQDVPRCYVFSLDLEEPKTAAAVDLLARWEDQRAGTIEPRVIQVVKILIAQADAYQNAGVLDAAGDLRRAIEWINQSSGTFPF